MMSKEPSPERLAGVWWAAGLLLVLLLPNQLWLHQAIWKAGPARLLQCFALGAAYILALAIATWLKRRALPALVISVAAPALTFAAAYVTFVYWAKLSFSTGVGAVAFALTALIVWIGQVLTGSVRRAASGLAFVSVLALFVVGYATPEEVLPAKQSKLVTTAHHRIRINYYNELLKQAQEARGGGFDRLGNHYVRMTGNGAFFRVRYDAKADAASADSLRIPAPFEANPPGGTPPPRAGFRALDLIARRTGSDIQLFATHHAWRNGYSCFVVEVSSILLDEQLSPRPGATWTRVFETRPCLATADPSSRLPPGIRLESGGRLAWLSPNQLLVSVGDHAFDGWNNSLAVAQSDTAQYGRTLVLDVTTGKAETFTLGHRNPQGLYIDGQGRAWETEHGPQGGDELNLLERGKNYGWPYETSGADYGRHSWPLLGKVAGRYENAAFVWVPSIGVSQVMSVPEGTFPRWRGDLLVSSLIGNTVYRVAVRDGHALFTEPIVIGRRIRDIVAAPDSSIWLWTDTGDLVSIAVADFRDEGEELFAQCGSCHLTDYNVISGGRAPSLRGIVGRDVAAMKDFKYSAALKSLGGTWTSDRLDQFLQDPAAYAPGTTMTFAGIKDAQQRAKLLEYLRELRR